MEFSWSAQVIYLHFLALTKLSTVYVFLVLFRNKISLLSDLLCLTELKVLDVSKNNIDHISNDCLSGCPKLETLNASGNRLSKFKWSVHIYI